MNEHEKENTLRGVKSPPAAKPSAHRLRRPAKPREGQDEEQLGQRGLPAHGRPRAPAGPLARAGPACPSAACPSLLPRRPSFPGCSSSTALMSGRLASPSVDGTQMHHICLCTALQYARMDAIIDEFNQKLTRLSSHACRTVRMPPNLQLTCLLPFSLVLVSPYTTCFLSLPLSLSPLLSSLPSRPLFPFRSLYFFSLALSRLAETQINNVSAIRGEGVKTKQKDK